VGESEDGLRETLAAQSSEPAPLARGIALDRYIILEALGGGGMGVVYAAYDPELDRKLAVKLLRAGSAAGGKARLQREAQAMARLQHPNVIAVYDVGTFRDQVFVAMEYVDGVTLRAWMDERPRSFGEVLGLFLPAGRALAAAHAARIVHRDFKPDNVMVGKDGRVRVLDFGLARGALDDADEPASSGHAPRLSSSNSALETPLTQTGALTRPFAGDNWLRLGPAVTKGTPSPPPADRGVPAWLRAVVERGLAKTPGERHPSMDALVAALSVDPDARRRQRRRSAVLVASFSALATVATVGLVKLSHVKVDRCRGAETRLAGVWDGARRVALRSAFAATGSATAVDAADRVVAQLDAYAAAWTHARTDAREATYVRGEQSEMRLDLRMACLDRRLGELRAQADLFAAADAQLVAKASEAASKLTPLGGCTDARALESVVPPPDDPSLRARVDALRARLAQAKVLEDAGKYKDGLAAATRLADEAAPLGYPPLTAEALARRASLEEYTGAAPAAVDTLGRALPLAAEGHDDTLVARLWPDLLFTVGLGLAEAREQYRRAVEIETRALGAELPQLAETLTALARTELDLGRAREAVGDGDRALTIREKLGQPAKDRAETLFVLARSLWATGEKSRSLELTEAVRDAFSAAGPAGAKARDGVEAWLRARRGPS